LKELSTKADLINWINHLRDKDIQVYYAESDLGDAYKLALKICFDLIMVRGLRWDELKEYPPIGKKIRCDPSLNKKEK